MNLELKLKKAIRRINGRTAYQLAIALRMNPSNVSSVLNQMWKRQEVLRIKGIGPKQGFGYYPKVKINGL